MTSAKQLVVKPIKAGDANLVIKRLHYSGKVVPNSQLHFGVFLNGKCGGALQFGPSMVKATMMNLVEGTGWNNFLELNRMAFADWLPRNSESRAIAYCMRYIRKHYPHIKWVVSFADGTQCGDGTIYRASGFVLTDIRRNEALRRNPYNGEAMHAMQAYHLMLKDEFKEWEPLDGFQLRYVYFLDPAWRDRLTVPVLQFHEIEKAGATMYRGQRPDGVSNTPAIHAGAGGANPTSGLQPTAPSSAAGDGQWA
jgi:hypothetical protein